MCGHILLNKFQGPSSGQGHLCLTCVCACVFLWAGVHKNYLERVSGWLHDKHWWDTLFETVLSLRDHADSCHDSWADNS